MIAKVQWQQGEGRLRWRFWIPLFILWLILAPFVLFLFPFFLLICLFTGVGTFRALGAFIELLSALRGTHIEIDDPHTRLLIRIY